MLPRQRRTGHHPPPSGVSGLSPPSRRRSYAFNTGADSPNDGFIPYSSAIQRRKKRQLRQKNEQIEPSRKPPRWKGEMDEMLSEIKAEDLSSRRIAVGLSSQHAVCAALKTMIHGSPLHTNTNIGLDVVAPPSIGSNAVLQLLHTFTRRTTLLKKQRLFALQVSLFRELVFVSLCQVALSHGANKQQIFSIMQTNISESADKQLSRLLKGALWANRVMDTLVADGFGQSACEIFLLWGCSISQYGRFAEAGEPGMEYFRSHTRIQSCLENQTSVPFWIPYIIKEIVSNVFSLEEICAALGYGTEWQATYLVTAARNPFARVLNQSSQIHHNSRGIKSILDTAIEEGGLLIDQYSVEKPQDTSMNEIYRSHVEAEPEVSASGSAMQALATVAGTQLNDLSRLTGDQRTQFIDDELDSTESHQDVQGNEGNTAQHNPTHWTRTRNLQGLVGLGIHTGSSEENPETLAARSNLCLDNITYLNCATPQTRLVVNSLVEGGGFTCTNTSAESTSTQSVVIDRLPFDLDINQGDTFVNHASNSTPDNMTQVPNNANCSWVPRNLNNMSDGYPQNDREPNLLFQAMNQPWNNNVVEISPNQTLVWNNAVDTTLPDQNQVWNNAADAIPSDQIQNQVWNNAADAIPSDQIQNQVWNNAADAVPPNQGQFWNGSLAL